MSVFNQVCALFVIIGAGYLANKLSIINKELNKALSKLLLNITFPLTIIDSFKKEYSSLTISNITRCFIYSATIYIILILIGWIFYIKFPADKKNISIFTTIFPNSGFMGIPIINAIYGGIGVIYISIFNIPFYIFAWTYGLMLYSNKFSLRGLKKAFLNPGIISVIIGLIIMIFSVKLPSFIDIPSDLIGNVTTPLSMLIIGSMLADTKIKEVFFDKHIYYNSFILLIIIPVITYCILLLFKVEPLLRNIIVIGESMPAASLTAILAENYNYDSRYASKVIFVSTLLSIITIPVIVSFLK